MDSRSQRKKENRRHQEAGRKYPESGRRQPESGRKPLEGQLSEAEGTDLIPGSRIEGRNPVLEAFRSGMTVDKLYVLKDRDASDAGKTGGRKDGPILSILREAEKRDTVVQFVTRERLDSMSETGKHQGVIAQTAAFQYKEVEELLAVAEEKGEPPFLFLLDEIEDPHNLGAIIRTANLCGAHGVIIPKRRAVSLTAVAARASAGAVCYTGVARVTNLTKTIEELKQKGIWFVCADMEGTEMYELPLTGPIGLVIGNEGKGVSRLVAEACDMKAAIPMQGDIDSLNASVACGVLAYEILRQRRFQKS